MIWVADHKFAVAVFVIGINNFAFGTIAHGVLAQHRHVWIAPVGNVGAWADAAAFQTRLLIGEAFGNSPSRLSFGADGAARAG